MVVKVQKPTVEEAGKLRTGAVLIGFLQPLTDQEGIDRLAAQGVVAFAMESIPRITRAQSMDALSSQATVGGYKAALIAADRLPRFLPMLTTAAGTVQPAKVLVIGAGVAGLQAIRDRPSPRRGRVRLRRPRQPSGSRSSHWARSSSTSAFRARRPPAATRPSSRPSSRHSSRPSWRSGSRTSTP